MKRPTLKAEKRKIFGKKVKKLRKEAILPVNLYGKKVKSQALQVVLADFRKVYKEGGETGLIDLVIEKSKEARTVLIHNLQTHPVSDEFLHADFHQVALKEKIKTEISLEIKGESPAVSQKKGILLQPLNKVEIEALPTDLPEQIEIDISKLTEVGQEIKVANLKVGEKINILTGKDFVVAKIAPLEEEVAEEIPKKTKEEKEEAKEEEKPQESKEKA